MALLSNPDGDWPPYRLTERPVLEKIEAFRASLGATQTFAVPAELPESVGALVSEAIARRGTDNDFGLKPWERAYLGYSVEVWRGGRTAASRSYLLDSGAREEPYAPELYIALDGTVEGWVCGKNGKPRRAAAGERKGPRNQGLIDQRVPLARWLSCPDFPRLALVVPYGTPEKAQVLAQRLEELAQEHAEARGRLLGLAAAGMIESRELFPSIDFGVKAEQLAKVYERDSTTWFQRDRLLVLAALSRLDVQHGDPRLRGERWLSFSGGEVVLGDEIGDLIRQKLGTPTRKVAVAPFAMAWAPVSGPEYGDFAQSRDFSDHRFWSHTPRKLRGKHSRDSQSLVPFFQRYGSPRFGSGWNGPMIGISIYEALAYCAWRTAQRKDGRVVRLPTESEWEYVARADGGSPYPWGAELPSETNDMTGRGWSGIEQGGIYSVMGVFPPIAGVVDLVSSVQQWCDSFFDDPYGERPTYRAQKHGGVLAPSWTLVHRGGYRGNDDKLLVSARCAFRTGHIGQTSVWPCGSRLVLDPPP